jgi:hypothetical protein
VVVTFFVAVQLLLNRHYFALPPAQYGAVYVPVLAAAVLAALVTASRSRSAARGRVFRLGLTLTAVGRAAIIPTVAFTVRHGAVFFPDLVIIGALTGAGFALVLSAATAFELDIDPARPEGPMLRLNLTLAAGMAAGPVLQIGVVEAGLWWVFPLVIMVLAVLLLGVSPRSRLGPDAARSCALRDPARRVPGRVWAYLLVAFIAAAAVVICVAWSQVGMIGPVATRISPRVLGLGAFWAALAWLARAGFSAIDMHAPFRRAASLGLFLLPAVVTVIGLAIGRAGTAVIGIVLLAAVVCAASLPPLSQLVERQLVVLPLVVGAGLIGIYPVAIGLARPSLSGFRSSGAPLSMIFAMAGVVAIGAFLACARLIAFRGEYAGQGGSSGGAQGGTPAAAGSVALTAGQGATMAGRYVPRQELPPRHARPSTAVELPRQKATSHENEDQPGAQSGPSPPVSG